MYLNGDIVFTRSQLIEGCYAPGIGNDEKAFFLFVLISRPTFAAQGAIRSSMVCMVAPESQNTTEIFACSRSVMGRIGRLLTRH